MNVISMRRFLTCIGVSCLLGGIFGLVGGLMDWSDGIAFAVLCVAGTVVAVVTLYENPLGNIPLHLRRHTRHQV